MNKIISISVWGDNPQYCIGAIRNLQLSKNLLSDWKCRLFIDDTVPSEYIKIYEQFDNAELCEVENNKIYGAFWRFYSMFESEDNICISRDSDSRISEREVKIINEWLDSDKKFSIIKDHERHYDWPILAGMWGMKGSLDDSILSSMENYAQHHFYTSDQIFLKDVVWPIAKTNSLIHGFLEVDWMKNTRNDLHFIGQGYDKNDMPIYSGEKTGKRVR